VRRRRAGRRRAGRGPLLPRGRCGRRGAARRGRRGRRRGRRRGVERSVAHERGGWCNSFWRREGPGKALWNRRPRVTAAVPGGRRRGRSGKGASPPHRDQQAFLHASKTPRPIAAAPDQVSDRSRPRQASPRPEIASRNRSGVQWSFRTPLSRSGHGGRRGAAPARPGQQGVPGGGAHPGPGGAGGARGCQAGARRGPAGAQRGAADGAPRAPLAQTEAHATPLTAAAHCRPRSAPARPQSSDPDVLSDWPAALHLLGHIFNNDLEDARFLWKRLPLAQQVRGAGGGGGTGLVGAVKDDGGSSRISAVDPCCQPPPAAAPAPHASSPARAPPPPPPPPAARSKRPRPTRRGGCCSTPGTATTWARGRRCRATSGACRRSHWRTRSWRGRGSGC
jgi:hypothetical protein